MKLCQTNEKYYTAWEEGRGPSQNTMTSGEGRPTRVNKFGPGSVLTRMLKRCGLKYTLNCKCKKRAHQMDLWGPDGCEENMDTILGWLKEEAEKRNLPFARTAAKLLVKEAIRRSRKKLASVEHVTA